VNFWSKTRTARFAMAFGVIVPAVLSVTMVGTANAAPAAPNALQGNFVRIESFTTGQKCMDTAGRSGDLSER
jgi:hypothetical protein